MPGSEPSPKKADSLDLIRQMFGHKALFHHLSDPVFIVDARAIILAANPSAVAIFQKSKTRLTGRSIFRLGMDQPAQEALAAGLKSPDPDQPVFVSMEKRDGKPVETRHTLFGLPAAGKKAETACVDLVQEKSRVREAGVPRQLFFKANLLDQAPESIMAADKHGRILYWGKGAAQLYGWSPMEMMGQSLESLFPDDDPMGWKDLFNQVFDTGHYSGRVCHKRKDGSVFWTDSRMAPIAGVSGGIAGVMSIERDITETLEVERKLSESQQQLFQSQKMETLGTLVSGVAHEINNPVSLLMFNVPLLRKVWQDFRPVFKNIVRQDPEKKYGGLSLKYLEKKLGRLLSDMELAASRIARIVESLKHFSRRSDITEKQPMSLNTAVLNALKIGKTFIRKSSVKLELNLDPSIGPMEGNIQAVEHIVLNLVTNAIQATDQGGGRIVIQTGYNKDAKTVFLKVSDNGKGIDPALTDRLFEPFVTSRQTEGGSGLGLSITYNLVKIHDGTISFKSRADNGTVFLVNFPACPAKSPFRVLVADDEEGIRHLLTSLISRNREFVVEEAKDGIEALIKLGTFLPHVMILDINMPNMDGVQVCRTLKRDKKLSLIRVVVITGLVSDPRVCILKEMGCDKIYLKPMDLKRFMGDVTRLAREARSREEAQEA